MANSTGNRPIYRQALIEKYLERYVEGHMTASITIHRGSWPDLAVLYSGRARLHLMSGAVQMGFGDEPQYMVSGTVSIPEKTEEDGTPVSPMINDLIVVTAHHDERTVGRTFRVMHVNAAGQFNGIITMSVIGSEDSGTTTARL